MDYSVQKTPNSEADLQIKPQSIEGFPLSPQQQRIWILQGATQQIYKSELRLRIRENLEQKQLESAARSLVEQLEILRTTYQVLPGMRIPLQVIQDESEIHYLFQDLSQLDIDQQSEQIKIYAQIPFDLERGPMLRILHARVSSGYDILLIQLPALCADTKTLRILAVELLEIYFGKHEQTDNQPQYVDISEWQNELFEDEEAEAGRAFWRKLDRLKTRDMRIFSSVRSDVQSVFDLQVYKRKIDSEVSEIILELAEWLNTTPAILFLTYWQILLMRLGEEDSPLQIGLVCDERIYPELENACGPLSKVLPLQIDSDTSPFFRDLLAQTEVAVQKAMTWQEAFFPYRDPQVFVPYSFEFEQRSILAGELEISIDHLISQQDIFRIKLSCWQRQKDLGFEIHYDSKSFSDLDVKRLAEHLYVLMRNQNINVGARDLQILSDQQRNQLLLDFGTSIGQVPHPILDKEFPALFEAQAIRTPHRIALVCADRQLTYGELNQRANQLAHLLRRRGVGPEVRVGIWLERSIEMIVAMLAILKAGGAYVPLDLTYPAERLKRMLTDAQATLVLTQGEQRKVLEEIPAEVIDLANDKPQIDRENSANLPSIIFGQNLAYILFTSGSTGQPKAIGVEHRQLSSYLGSILTQLEISDPASFATVSTFAADLGHTMIFPALYTGGTLHIISSDRIGDPEALVKYLQYHAIDYLKIVPSHFAALLGSSSDPKLLLPRRQLILGGEVSPWSLIEQIRSLRSSCQILNHYGPTETTVGVLTYSLPSETLISTSESCPLGRPLCHVQIYLLDPDLRPVPIGVPGEIYIGGSSVTRGYLGRPDLTAERFIPNPFSSELGTCLYRTGDRARYHSDGTVEFLGRMDRQVKVRGVRIELGEVEAALREHADIRDAIVMLQEMDSGPHLIAYYIPEQEEPSGLILREFLQKKLPAPLIPSHFIRLSSWPLTSNGKIDRAQLRELPLPATTSSDQEKPQTEVEQIIMQIWQQLLQREQVDRAASFFELGGHSLLATQLISRLRRAFSVEIPLQIIFDQPTVAGLATSVEAALHQGSVPVSPIKPVSCQLPLPLSFAQQRLWFLDQLDPNSSVYSIPFAFRLQGKLDLLALAQSFVKIGRRHEIWRTRITWHDHQPVQTIDPEPNLPLPIVDLRENPQGEPEAEQLIRDQIRRPFDLEVGPLVRLLLIHLSEDDFILLLTCHHLVFDAWSRGILLKELTTLYQSYLSNQPSHLPDLPIQYGDYAVWQRQWLQGEVLQAQLEYWQQQLAGVPPLDLPTDCPRPSFQTFRGRTQRIQFSPTLTQALKDISRQQDVTLFMTLLAGFNLLLYRYTDQADIAIGSPVINRHRSELEGLLGCFNNTVVLRTDLSQNPTLRELLYRVRQVSLGSFTHQDLPFELLVESLPLERDLSRSPLFQVLFTLQNAPIEKLELPDLMIESLPLQDDTTKFDLSLLMGEGPTGLEGVLEYNANLFDENRIIRMINHYQILLEGFTKNLDQSISQIPILSESERKQLIVDWNQTYADPSLNPCFYSRIEQQALLTPDIPAVIFEGSHLTYQDLNHRANQLAHYLSNQGVGPEVCVGIYMDRSLDIVVSLLGILKSGGFYLPLDPALPSDRLAWMISDSKAAFLLTDDSPLPLSDHPQLISLKQTWSQIALESTENLNPRIHGTNLAYLIYTSGSTGRPKGVQISHQALHNFLQGMEQQLQTSSQDKVFSITTLSFDIAALEIFLPLMVGAQLQIVPRSVARDGERLIDYLKRDRPTLMQATPATWQMMLVAGWQGNDKLTILCGGEALPASLARQLRQRCRSLWNLYGPTETTIWSAAHHLSSEIQGDPTIAQPISNTHLYVLDRHLNPLPLGIPGELFIGGMGVARGYWGRPDLTADRFIPDPFSADPGQRLYRTGDRVYYREDGTLGFLGRIDHQVKIRGYRIELGEIESVLEDQEDVQQAIVILREGHQNNRQILAFVLSQVTVDLSALRFHLRKVLPEYMIPHSIEQLSQFPLTPNGKVDRKELARYQGSSLISYSAGSDQRTLAIATPVEEILINLWERILSVEGIQVNDNFFDLGGHSLLATQVISQLRASLGLEIPLRLLFESPTIATLSPQLENILKEETGSGTQKISPALRDHPIPLSFSQQRLWFLDQIHPGDPAYNIFFALEIEGAIDLALLHRSLQQILDRHEVLRTTFTLTQAEPIQIISDHLTLEIPVIDLQQLTLDEQEHEVNRLAHQEADQPFDLSQGPLIRLCCVQLTPMKSVSLLTMHHIISDGWSMGVLIKELITLYQAGVQGISSSLPDLPIQYADFAIWQKHWLQGEILEQQLNYWQQHLAGAIPAPTLPTDHPRPQTARFSAGTVSISLPSELTRGLKQLSRQTEVTLYMVLLAGLNTLLHRRLQQDTIVIGTDSANRNRPEVEGLIGFFVNLLVLRTDLSGDPTVLELLQRVREVALGGYAHQDLPFEKLVEVMQTDRQLGQVPLFQVLLVFQNLPIPKLDLPELSLRPLRINNRSAKFDIALFMAETGKSESGLVCTWQYNTELFNADTIQRLAEQFRFLLEDIVRRPEIRLSQLEYQIQVERDRQEKASMQNQVSRFQKFKGIKPKPVALPQDPPIRSHSLFPETSLPLVVEPNISDFDPMSWANDHREWIIDHLHSYGAILFRGMDIASVDHFEQFALKICPQLFGEYGDLPRVGIRGNVYSSTPYPEDRAILFHNESSHQERWPLRIGFYCVQPAQQGGSTPIVDCRCVYQKLDPQLRDRFAQKGLMYVRNFIEGIDVSWQHFFQTQDRLEVEARCHQAGIRWRWMPKDGLRIWQVRQAIAQHPKTGDQVWFNQVLLHHVACLDQSVQHSLLSTLGEENLPRHVYYGDGNPIKESEIKAIQTVFQDAEIRFPWQRGDVLILDNMLTAHGRDPYQGPRQIVVVMGEMVEAQPHIYSVAKQEAES